MRVRDWSEYYLNILERFTARSSQPQTGTEIEIERPRGRESERDRKRLEESERDSEFGWQLSSEAITEANGKVV